MDPVTMIVAAIVAGAAETASQAVKDTYVGLKDLIKRRFAGDSKAEEALADPEKNQEPLAEKVREKGADRDDEILQAAKALLKEADSARGNTVYNIAVNDKGKIGAVNVKNARIKM